MENRRHVKSSHFRASDDASDVDVELQAWKAFVTLDNRFSFDNRSSGNEIALDYPVSGSAYKINQAIGVFRNRTVAAMGGTHGDYPNHQCWGRYRYQALKHQTRFLSEPGLQLALLPHTSATKTASAAVELSTNSHSANLNVSIGGNPCSVVKARGFPGRTSDADHRRLDLNQPPRTPPEPPDDCAASGEADAANASCQLFKSSTASAFGGRPSAQPA